MAKSIDAMSFDDAFKKKRRELGPGKTFTWQGEKYTTDRKDDPMDDLTPRGNLPSPEDNVTEGGPRQRNTPRNPPKGAKDPAPMTRVDMGGVSFGDPDMTREEQESIAKNLLKGVVATGGGPAGREAVRGAQTAVRRYGIGRNYERMSESERRNWVRNAAREAREVDGMRSGGRVKKYASGGSVSSASKRADGCAVKGKTRGKFV
jgi:hypothetical protein